MEGLLDAQGVWQEDEKVMGEILLDYYTNLFTSSNPTVFDEILEAVQPRVTSRMNQKLTMEFTVDEVNVALKQMYPLKALSQMVCLLYFINIFGQKFEK